MSKKETQLIKGIAIILMIYHHLFAYADYDLYYSILPQIGSYRIEQMIGLFGKICVTSYLFLSGYGMGYKLHHDYKLKHSTIQIWKFYKVFLFVFAIFIPIEFFITGRPIVLNELISNLTGYNTTYNYEWWFIINYVILILLLPVIKNINSRLLLFFSISAIIGVYGLRWFLNRPTIYLMAESVLNSQPWVIFYNLMICQFSFILGLFFNKYNLFDKLFNITKRMNKYLAGLFFIVIIIIKVYVPGGYALDTLMVPIFILLCIKIIQNNSTLTKFFLLSGKHSTVIWLTHTFYIYYFFDKSIYTLKHSLLIFIVGTLVSIMNAVIFTHLTEILTKVFNKLKYNRHLK